jgi:hypothetical protein
VFFDTYGNPGEGGLGGYNCSLALPFSNSPALAFLTAAFPVQIGIFLTSRTLPAFSTPDPFLIFSFLDPSLVPLPIIATTKILPFSIAQALLIRA